jgi:hypothetical protein
MAPQKRIKSEPSSKPKKPLLIAPKVSTKSSSTKVTKPTCHEPSSWGFPGFLLLDKPRFAYFHPNLFAASITDEPVLLSNVTDTQEKKTSRAHHTVTMLFKALLFHRDFYQTREPAIFKFLATFTFHRCTANRIRRIEAFYVSARRAYLTKRDALVVKDVRTFYTDLVDEWIAFLDSHNPTSPSIDDGQFEAKFESVRNEWSAIVRSGLLLNPSQVDEAQVKTKTEHVDPTIPNSSERSAASSTDDDDVNQEQEDDSESDSPPSTPTSTRALPRTTKHQKRKASTLANSTPKRRKISDTSDDQTSESDLDAEVENAALAELRELAHKRHAHYTTKLQKMKDRHSAQKKRVTHLEQQLAEVTNAQTNQSLLSSESKLNSKSLKQMTKDLKQQKGTVNVLQKLVEGMEVRLKKMESKMEPPPRVIAEEFYQKITERLTDRVKDEVKTTWKGAALELSNTRKIVDEHGQRFDTLDSHISKQKSITERHEKSLKDISVKQTTRISLLETDLKAKVDGHADRLSSIESQLPRQSQGRVKSENDMPQYPPHIPGIHRTAQLNEIQELRAIIDSQGKQMGEMAREMDELKAMAKDVPTLEISKKLAKEVTELKGWSRELANCKELRRTMSTVLGRQSFGEQSPNGEAGKELVNLNEVCKEMGNFKQMRTTLASVLNRQTFEDALASRPASSRPSTPPGPAFQSPVVQQALQSAVDLKRDLEAIQRGSDDKDTAARLARMMEKLENLEKAIVSPRSSQ